MKSRGGARRRYRGRKKREARRPATPMATATPSTPRSAPPPPPPVAGIPHRQVLDDIKKIGIIGGAVLALLLVLFLIWR